MDNVVLFPHLGSSTVSYPPEDGTARGRQPAGLGRRQAAADAGARDALAAEEAGVIICRHGPSAPRSHSLLLTAFAAPLAAQAPAPDATAPARRDRSRRRARRQGRWSGAGSSPTPTARRPAPSRSATIRPRSASGSNSIRPAPRCFPFIREIVGWRLNRQRLPSAARRQGNSVLEFSEVESGIFEAPRPGEGILFIQNAGGARPGAEDRRADRPASGRSCAAPASAICALTLSNTAAGEEFVVRVQPPCDPVVTRFAPATWQMDRGEIVLRSAQRPVLALRGRRGREVAAHSARPPIRC